MKINTVILIEVKNLKEKAGEGILHSAYAPFRMTGRGRLCLKLKSPRKNGGIIIFHIISCVFGRKAALR